MGLYRPVVVHCSSKCLWRWDCEALHYSGGIVYMYSNFEIGAMRCNALQLEAGLQYYNTLDAGLLCCNSQ